MLKNSQRKMLRSEFGLLRQLQNELATQGAGVLDSPRRLDEDTLAMFQDILREESSVWHAQHRARMEYFNKLITASIQAVQMQGRQHSF